MGAPESNRLVLEEAFDVSGPSHKGKKGGAGGGGGSTTAPAGGPGRKITGLVVSFLHAPRLRVP